MAFAYSSENPTSTLIRVKGYVVGDVITEQVMVEFVHELFDSDIK